MSLCKILLYEIGDELSHLNTYDYKEVNLSNDKFKQYKFTTDKNEEYNVYIENIGNNNWELEFESRKLPLNTKTNRENIIKTINTVFKAVKEFVDNNNNKINNLLIYPYDSKRYKIFKYFIEKLFPNKNIKYTNNKVIKIKL